MLGEWCEYITIDFPGPKCAEEKLKYCKAVEKFDFVTTEEDGIKSANDELNEKGIKVFNIKGDVACNGVMCLVQNEVLLSCDVGKYSIYWINWIVYIN